LVLYHVHFEWVLCSEFNVQQLRGPHSSMGTRNNFSGNMAVL